MKSQLLVFVLVAGLASLALDAKAQTVQEDTSKVILSLEDAIKIALSENTSVKVADKEIERSEYAKKGAYAALYPTIDASGAYQRTIKKQVMYMDFEMPAGMGGGMSDGLEVGRWNTWSAGVSAAMPLVNAQLWQSLKISGEDVELAVEKARGSRLETVTQVKNAYFGVLLAKQVFEVYREVYENALDNCERTQKKYNVQKASELDLARAKTALANAIPDVFDSESAISLALWQLKAVMGVNLDRNIDIAGTLMDYSVNMVYDINATDAPLDGNTTLKQLALQADELAKTVKLQQAAYIPSLALAFSYSLNAMTNDFKFNEYKWSPYSYVGLSLSIPIFSGGKRLNQVRQAKVQSVEMELRKADTERQLRIAIRQYVKSMDTAMKSFTAANDALGSAEKAYSIAKKSYELGRSTLTDLNDAQLALVQARLAVSQSVYTFITAKAGLEQTLGQDFIQ